MRPRDRVRAKEFDEKLLCFDREARPLPGIRSGANRGVLIEQLIESLRRVEYAHFIRDEQFDSARADVTADIFDPLRAAVYRMRRGDTDEAFWLVFLFVHFGKHPKDGWRLIRDIYGALGGNEWTWNRVSANPSAFRRWLAASEETLRNDGTSRRFGNHRKYESLNASSPAGTAAVIESYVQWVTPPRTHQQLVEDAHRDAGQHPRAVFDYLYRSMKAVRRFGRLARFDYLTMVGKLGLAPIEPGSAYMSGSTGPLKGARMLFGGNAAANLSANELDTFLNELDSQILVGMQVLEDALCNWQKSPGQFVSFRG
jgi:hypothetical protein